MKKLLRIFATNWIHFPGFYLSAYVYFIAAKLFGPPNNQSWEDLLLHNTYGILVLFLFFGLFVVMGFYLALAIMDFILFKKENNKPRQALLIEWALFALVAIFFAFRYDYWLWLALAISFYITQMMRLKKIRTIVEG
ncbi:MAG: hypothetical protein RLN86_14005 [Cyclobacteriaceae bacterium]